MKKIIPRISTRGYYDLHTGRTLKRNKFYLYPKRAFNRLAGSAEFTIMIHGLRNDSQGAVEKVVISQRRLRLLGYHYPLVGFSYDSNTTGAHLIKHAKHALAVGKKIAIKNGRNLALFVEEFKGNSPDTKIRLMGHSLGSQVILSAVEQLSKKQQNRGIIESVHFFGASITCDVPSCITYRKIFDHTIAKKITNYYSPSDDVLYQADSAGLVKCPLGLNGATGKTSTKYCDVMVVPKNHRFASYAEMLESFP
ncbi:MAG: DUF726 domain-containing protein [Thaumarchaeota archaeon]|nr:DUF726 domain-containing protein [Nitrososphaerota archaeon]